MGTARHLCTALLAAATLVGCASSATQLLEVSASTHEFAAAPLAGRPPSEPRPPPLTHSLDVTATAYNSLPGQTWGDPNVAAWGDRLEPGMQSIAVSRDLLSMGLTRGTEVEIEGMPGRWVVLDKMGRRWKRRIDLYMGVDRKAALQWGRRKVTIRYSPSE